MSPFCILLCRLRPKEVAFDVQTKQLTDQEVGVSCKEWPQHGAKLRRPKPTHDANLSMRGSKRHKARNNMINGSAVVLHRTICHINDHCTHRPLPEETYCRSIKLLYRNEPCATRFNTAYPKRTLILPSLTLHLLPLQRVRHATEGLKDQYACVSAYLLIWCKPFRWLEELHKLIFSVGQPPPLPQIVG